MVIILNRLHRRNSIQEYKIGLCILGYIILLSNQRRTANRRVFRVLAIERTEIGVVELNPIDTALFREVCRLWGILHLARNKRFFLRERLVGQRNRLNAHIAIGCIVCSGNLCGHCDNIFLRSRLVHDGGQKALCARRCLTFSKSAAVLLFAIDSYTQGDFRCPGPHVDAQIARLCTRWNVKGHFAARPIDHLTFRIGIGSPFITEIGRRVPSDLCHCTGQLDVRDSIVLALLGAIFERLIAEMNPTQRSLFFQVRFCRGAAQKALYLRNSYLPNGAILCRSIGRKIRCQAHYTRSGCRHKRGQQKSSGPPFHLKHFSPPKVAIFLFPRYFPSYVWSPSFFSSPFPFAAGQKASQPLQWQKSPL